MLRAFIVDDEPKVCRLIGQLGHWERLDIEITGVYHDGEEALNAILAEAPDIVITDIRMPVFDGLTLIERTRKAGLDTAFIIISGYRHFEYAHTAMQYGIIHYLLKPIDADELNEALEKVTHLVLEKRVRMSETQQLRHMRQADIKRLHLEFVTRLLDGLKEGAALEEYNTRYSLGFEPGLFRVAVLNTSLPQLHEGATTFSERVDEIARRLFAESANLVCAATGRGVVLVLGYAPENAGRVDRGISTLPAEVQALSDIFGEFSLVLGLGSTEDDFSGLGRSMERAVWNERSKLTLGWNHVLDAPWDKPPRLPGQAALQQELRSLAVAVDALNEEAIAAWFARQQARFETDAAQDAEALLALRDAVLELLSPLAEDEALHNLAMQSDRALDEHQMFKMLADALSAMVRSRLAEKGEAESRPIRRAKEYIQTHYAENVSLEDVARQAGFSAVYFSTLFKKVTGQSFADYLTEVRLERAKELLKTSPMSIIAISEAVGYQDNKHFRKLFKKAVGMRPGDYRKLYE